MKMLAAVVTLSITIALPGAAQELSGTFSSNGSPEVGKRVTGLNLHMSRGSVSTARTTAAELEAIPLSGPFELTLNRDAGAIRLEGTVRDGRAAGHFRFVPSSQFIPELRRRGVTGLGEIDAGDQLLMATLGLDLAYVDSLAAIGFEGLSAKKLLELSIHRVSAPWVRSLREAGYEVDSTNAVSLRIHGVDAELIRALSQAGYANLSATDLMAMAIHRVTPDYIREMRSAGINGLAARKLVEMKIHKVSAEFVRDLAQLGYGSVPPAKLIELRIHGVDSSFIRRVNDRRGSRTSLDDLIRMRIHRIDPDELG